MDNLNALLNVKNDIKSALKTWTESDITIPFVQYADIIRSMPNAVFNELRTNKLYNWMTFSESTADKSAFEQFDYSDKVYMEYMFSDCKKLTESPIITSSPVKCTRMFQGCTSLTKVNYFYTSKCDWFVDMFNGCTSLTELPKFKFGKMYASNPTGPVITRMFKNCKSLTSIEFEFKNGIYITGLDETFYGCSNLTTLGLIKTYQDFSEYKAFYGCSNLTNVAGFENMGYNLDLSYCPLLTFDSLKNIIYKMAMHQGSSFAVLKLHKDAAARLTDALITVATDKNWKISY